MYVIFVSSLGSFFQRSEFNNTLLYQNERGGNTATRTSTSLSHSIRVLSLLLSLCKNHKKPEVDKKIQACKTLTSTEGFVFSSCRCSKQSVSCLLTLNWSEHFGGVAFKFAVETIHHYYCMLVKSFI